MGKASKWFRSLLNLKQKISTTNKDKSERPNRRWSFVKSYRESDRHAGTQSISNSVSSTSAFHRRDAEDEYYDLDDRSSAVAAATAAVADAAVAAAQAAAVVVRLTTAGGRSSGVGDELGVAVAAAVTIQSAFRGYLAKRALRALRGLVRLQAIVRGHIDRKRTAAWCRRIQALLQSQDQARAGRIQISESSQSSSKGSHCHQPGPPTPEKVEHRVRSKSAKYEYSSMLKRNGSISGGHVITDQDKTPQSGRNWLDRHIDRHSQDLQPLSVRFADENTDKTWLDRHMDRSKDRHIYHSTHLTHGYTSSERQPDISSYSCEVDFVKPLKFGGEIPFCTADNSPQFYSASSKGGSSRRSPFTPTKNDCSRSFLSGFSDHPNYMSYTESSIAKVRSISAPKQRPNYERSFSTKRNSVHKNSALHSNFTSKAYPGSGRLNSMGMPVGYRF